MALVLAILAIMTITRSCVQNALTLVMGVQDLILLYVWPVHLDLLELFKLTNLVSAILVTMMMDLVLCVRLVNQLA